MWRCHCGETNLGSAAYCAQCKAPKLTHEEKDRAPRKRESNTRNVQVGFLGVGVGRNSERKFAASTPADRVFSETEISEYYAQQRRRGILTWLMYAAAALAVVGLMIWQVMRKP